MSEALAKIQHHSIAVAVGTSLLLTFSGTGLYVDQLFVTFVHEACHGLAAILTGGSLVSFYVQPDTSGMALTQGGFRPLVLAAGYMGSCLWGGALLVAARRRGWEKAVLFGLAAFLIGCTVLFVRNLFGAGVGLGLGLFFGWAAWHGKSWQLSLLLSFLAVQNVFFAFKDLLTLVRLSGSPVMTDAQLMSKEFTFGLVPPVVFALLIAAMAIATFFVFLKIALKADSLPALVVVRKQLATLDDRE